MLSPLFTLIYTLALVAPPTGVKALPDIQKRAANSSTIWVIDDIYKGANFFDAWNFWDRPDPTHGQVTYVNRETAMGKSKLAWVEDNGQVIMKVDNSSWLDQGAPRESVRISTKKLYTHGLFILDVERVPFGCGIWPAFWTNGYNWPGDGEIDIIEGVHDNIYNQVAWHTLPGCYLTNPGNFTGIAGQTDCDAAVNYNAGCAIRDPSRTSYGDGFKDYGGGVYAMKWDENSIDVWFFYRATIPKDIRDGFPDPTRWGLPSASLAGSACSIDKYFMNHMVVFDTTICGDWAGSSYPSHCPGSCTDMVKDPKNFNNAYWVINSLIVYKRTGIAGRIASTAPKLHAGRFLPWTAFIFTSFLFLSLEFLGVS